MAPISLRKGLVDVLTGQLLKHMLDIEDDDDNYKVALQYAMSNFRFHRYLDVNTREVDKSLQGIAVKFRVGCDEEKASCLEKLVERFLGLPLLDSDDSVKTEHHYSLLSMLLHLAESPSNAEYKPGPARQKEQEQEEVDWKAYLLDDEEEPQLGVPVDFDDEHDLDSDDDFWAVEVEQKTEKARTLTKQDYSNITENEDVKIQDKSWFQDNVIKSYWKKESPFVISNKNYSLGSNETCKNWEIWKQSDSSGLSSGLPNGLPSGLSGGMPSQKKLVTERQVVRETIWMIQGVKELYIYKFCDGIYELNSDVVLTHLSQATLHEYMQKFALIGRMVADLKSFCEITAAGEHGHSKTFRAFGFVIGRYLMGRNTLLSEVERNIINEDDSITLSGLTSQLSSDFDMISFIHDIYKEAVVGGMNKFTTSSEKVKHFFDVFYDVMCSLDALGDASLDKMSTVLPMFVDVCRLYLEDVDKWMTTGELPSSTDDEFFIYRGDNIQREESNYWRDSFGIKENADSVAQVPDFLEAVIKQILLSGKSLGLLQDFGNFTACVLSSSDLFQEFRVNLQEELNPNQNALPKVEEEPVYNSITEHRIDSIVNNESLDPLLRKNFQNVFLNGFTQLMKKKSTKKIHTFDWKQVLNDGSCRPPLTTILEKSLHPLILHRYDKACAVLVNMLKKDFLLSENLLVMQSFLLMEEEGTLHQFFSEIFLKAKLGEPWQEVSYLNIALQDTLQSHHAPIPGNISVSMRPQEGSVDAFNGLTLNYRAVWPISLILDAETEKKYNLIFSFLLKIKRAIWCLDQLRFNELTSVSCDEPAKTSHDELDELEEDEHKSHPVYQRQKSSRRMELTLTSEERAVSQQMLILRMKMAHVMKTFHSYVRMRIQHSTCSPFLHNVRQAKDLDEILQLHNQFLDELTQKCFLSEKVASTKEAILRLARLSLNFQDLWLASVRHVTALQLEKIEKDFTRCRLFLASFFSGLTKRGSYPHFQFLAHALRFECDGPSSSLYVT